MAGLLITKGTRFSPNALQDLYPWTTIGFVGVAYQGWLPFHIPAVVVSVSVLIDIVTLHCSICLAVIRVSTRGLHPFR